METKHTPGPWKIMPIHADDYRSTVMAGGEYGQYVATVNLRQTDMTRTEQEANARLIAESPAMYDACISVHDIINSYSHMPAIKIACEKLQAVINRIEGIKP